MNSMIEVCDGSAPGAQSASSTDWAATPALGFVTPARAQSGSEATRSVEALVTALLFPAQGGICLTAPGSTGGADVDGDVDGDGDGNGD
jgi:hypothetical protein